jgi:hypothetical protein
MVNSEVDIIIQTIMKDCINPDNVVDESVIISKDMLYRAIAHGYYAGFKDGMEDSIAEDDKYGE